MGISTSKYRKWLFLRMFNLRIISVCLGHTGVQIKRWVPLTSNLLKWKSKLRFHWDFQDNFLCQSILFSPTRPVWFGMIWFSSLLLSIPFLTLHCDPLCFLLGECVGIPPQEVAAASPSPTPPTPQELCGTFHTSYSGTGWRVCVVHWCARSSTLTALE